MVTTGLPLASSVTSTGGAGFGFALVAFFAFAEVFLREFVPVLGVLPETPVLLPFIAGVSSTTALPATFPDSVLGSVVGMAARVVAPRVTAGVGVAMGGVDLLKGGGEAVVTVPVPSPAAIG